jgi:RNA polymerase sigma-70 factor (ECF subfamily)
MSVEGEFDAFVMNVEPDLRRALSGHLKEESIADAVAEALAYAWEHRDRVTAMENPAGYLFRVAQSKARTRRQGLMEWSGERSMPDIEPGLPAALARLPRTQATAVWLVHGCGWSYAMTAEAMSISVSAVGTHLSRGLARLRRSLGVRVDG